MRKMLMSTALALVGTAAQAADNGFYLGVGAGRSDYDVPAARDTDDTAIKGIAGLRLLDSFGVELNYADHGKVTQTFPNLACITLVGVSCPPVVDIKAKTTSAFAVGFLDLPLIDLFAKAGLSYSDASVRSPVLPGFGGNDRSTEFAWGAGVQAHFLSFAVRAEYERFKVLERDLETISASLIYTFL